jgi:hypothetical protein
MMKKILDERYVLHRYKATSHAGVVMAVLTGGWFLYNQLSTHVYRWDLVAILGAGAVTKLIAMIYYRTHE